MEWRNDFEKLYAVMNEVEQWQVIKINLSKDELNLTDVERKPPVRKPRIKKWRYKMQIIKTHDITLYGGNDKYSIVLLPLADEHLPYLYKWNSDPEVLYWTEGGEDVPMSYSPETVHQIYGGISQNNLCFAVEVNGKIIGECWLQKMNLPNVKAMYDERLDVRRIDMAIGEKDYWGKGIGTFFIKMLIDFAFQKENVDILHCFCDDYNIRSRRVWEKNGFELILKEELPQPQKGKLEYHWRLTREKYNQVSACG